MFLGETCCRHRHVPVFAFSWFVIIGSLCLGFAEGEREDVDLDAAAALEYQVALRAALGEPLLPPTQTGTDGSAAALVEETPEDHSQEGSGCGSGFVRDLSSWASASGMPLYEGHGQTWYQQALTACRANGGRLARVTFDVAAFLNRSLAELRRAGEATDDLEGFWKQLDDTLLEQTSSGFSLCVPSICATERDVTNVALIYLACLAHPSCVATKGFKITPQRRREINVSFIDSEEDMPSPDVQAPWWLCCAAVGGPLGHTPERAEEWRSWGRDMDDLLSSWPVVRVSPEMAKKADLLCENHFGNASLWCSNVLAYSKAACGKEYKELEEESHKPSLHDWLAVEEFKVYHGFCPLGYASALVIRAIVKGALGLTASGAEDLRKMAAVMGSCMDLPWEELRQCASLLVPDPEAGGALVMASPKAWARCADQLTINGLRLLPAMPGLLQGVT